MPARLARLKDAASAPGRFVVSSDGPSYPTRFTRRESRAGLPNTYRPTEALQGEVRVLNDGRMPRRVHGRFPGCAPLGACTHFVDRRFT